MNGIAMSTGGDHASVVLVNSASAAGVAEVIGVPNDLQRHWARLPDVVRAHLDEFLSARRTTSVDIRVTVEVGLITRFADDLRQGGAELRSAFPALRRTVDVVRWNGRAGEVRITCRGLHTGVFYGHLAPSGRHVAFEERHELTLSAETIIDIVSIDFRTIVSQFAGSPSL